MSVLCQKFTTTRKKPYSFIKTIGNNFEYHWHDEIEIIYVKEGPLSFIIGSKSYNVNNGDLIIIKSGEIHGFKSNVECQLYVIEFGYYLDSDLCKTPVLINSGIPSVLKSDSVIYSKIKDLIFNFITEYEEQKEAWLFSTKAYLLNIITLLVREFSDNVKIKNEYKNIPYNNSEILQNVFDYINEHYYEEIAIEHISNIANFSKNYFNKYFKKATNNTLAAYIQNIRIEKAEGLLSYSSKNITDVALSVGFDSVKTFNRLFKDKNGCTPTQYRKNVHVQ